MNVTKEYIQQDVDRLIEMLNHDCVRYFDPQHVWVTVGDWQQNLMHEMIEYFLEENPMLATTNKTMVKMKGLAGGKIVCGIVAANYSVFVKELNVFEDLSAADDPKASLVFVRWLDKDGIEICSGWHDADTLEPYNV